MLTCKSGAEQQAYCDGDWAKCPNTRKSTTVFCILLGKSTIAWKSKKQIVVARSTAEAKYMSLATTICEVICVKELLKELGIKHLGSAPIFYDNQAALTIAANPINHEKTKHIGLIATELYQRKSE